MGIASEPVSFARTVPAGSTVSDRYDADGEATVEYIAIRIYPGPRLDLQVSLYRREKGSQRLIPLVANEGKTYFDGDDDVYVFDTISKPVGDDEEIVVEAENKDDSNSYNYRVNMTVDGRSGLKQYVSGVLS